MNRKYKVALAGNPNCGKTTIFNQLTGTRQHVGNYPGVTVERKVGEFALNDLQIELIDLPGIYSLSSASPEEKVAFQELVTGEIDLVLNVVDSGNLQRNLYLTTQLAELGIPMLLVFNMADDAYRKGIKFNLPMMSNFFGAPIVTSVGSSGRGLDRMKSKLAELLVAETPQAPAKLHYMEPAGKMIESLSAGVEAIAGEKLSGVPARYFAVKLLEKDPEVWGMPELQALHEEVEEYDALLHRRMNMSGASFMADQRYGIIAGACREAVSITNEKRRQLSDSIDKIALNRFLGLPIFLVMMYIVFWFTFSCAEPLMAGIEWFFGRLSDGILSVWSSDVLPFFRRMAVEGIIGGVGGVLVFLPNILLLFLAIAFLEGTGYMARAAFVMDGFMHKFGLHGKSFIPMLLGFGCSVPAVMATRTIESERDRLTTIMIVPFMSCGARLPIYALIIPAFFAGKYQALVMWIIYLIGVVIALGCALLLKSTLFKGEGEVFVMELPPYRLPTVSSLLLHMWERTLMYLKKAATLILLASVILFFINNFPEKKKFDKDYTGEIAKVQQSFMSQEMKSEAIAKLETERKAEALEYSVSGHIGKGMATVLSGIGFDWRVSSALIGATAAKELFVAQLGILYSVADADEESESLRDKLRENYTPLQGFCIMLFCLLTMPCVATMAVVRRETGSWRLTLLQIFGMTFTAYMFTLIVYQSGLLLKIGTSLL